MSPQSDKEQKHWIDYATLGLGIVGLVVLCIYAAYTIKIYCANKKSADAAKIAADAAKSAADIAYSVQRPWLGVDGVPTYKTTQGEPSSRMREFSVEIKNFGTSPAVKFAVNARPGTVERFRQDINGICSEAWKSSENMGSYLIPNETHNYIEQPKEITVSEGGPLPTDNSVPTIVGCIVYFGPTGDRSHHTEFCYTASATPNGTLPDRCRIKQDAD